MCSFGLESGLQFGLFLRLNTESDLNKYRILVTQSIWFDSNWNTELYQNIFLV